MKTQGGEWVLWPCAVHRAACPRLLQLSMLPNDPATPAQVCHSNLYPMDSDAKTNSTLTVP